VISTIYRCVLAYKSMNCGQIFALKVRGSTYTVVIKNFAGG